MKMKGEKMKSKKHYETADIEVIKLDECDVITTSQIGDGNDTDDGGWTNSKVW